jgi:chromosome segregation ATPase
LDLHRLQIDDLRRALEDKEQDLQRVQKEKHKISNEKSDVARTVAALEADLRRVRRDAEEFGHDLKLLRRDKENLEAKNKDEIASAERARKQAQTQIRLLNEQLDTQKEKTLRALEQLNSHVCAASVISLVHYLLNTDEALQR